MNKGVNWDVRIRARRLICVEASTYLSHQWVVIVAKVVKGEIYAWVPWLADRFKEYYLASQMSECPFSIPSLLVVICIDALGPPRWINPNEQHRLNSYLCLRRKREDAKDKEIGELRAFPSIEQGTMAIEFLPNLYPHVNLLREKDKEAKEAPSMNPEVQAKLSQLESEAIGLRGKIFSYNFQVFEKERIINEIQLKRLIVKNQPRLLGYTSLSTRDEIPEFTKETVVPGINRGPGTIMPSVEGKDFEARKALTILHLPNLHDVDKPPTTISLSQGSKELISTILVAPLLVIPLGFHVPHTSPHAHYELPLSGTSDVERFEVVPSIAYADSTTLPSTLKRK
eukprot:Gb_13293 [translate_table: standard]